MLRRWYGSDTLRSAAVISRRSNPIHHYGGSHKRLHRCAYPEQGTNGGGHAVRRSSGPSRKGSSLTARWKEPGSGIWRTHLLHNLRQGNGTTPRGALRLRPRYSTLRRRSGAGTDASWPDQKAFCFGLQGRLPASLFPKPVVLKNIGYLFINNIYHQRYNIIIAATHLVHFNFTTDISIEPPKIMTVRLKRHYCEAVRVVRWCVFHLSISRYPAFHQAGCIPRILAVKINLQVAGPRPTISRPAAG